MAKYRIEIKRSAVKELKKIPTQDLKKILVIIDSLPTKPRPQNAVKLSGEEKYRIRSGDYRILYSIEDDVLVVTVVKVAHRKDVYRKK